MNVSLEESQQVLGQNIIYKPLLYEHTKANWGSSFLTLLSKFKAEQCRTHYTKENKKNKPVSDR